MQQSSNLKTLVGKAVQNEVSNLAIFEEISNQINSNSQNAYQFIDILVKLLSSQKDPKQQYIILDLIEFTTCRCNMLLHKLYNDKKFLKLINAIFNQNNLTLLIKEKNLQLISFWKHFFSGKEDILPNFNWYYQNIVQRGIELPSYEPSKYLLKSVPREEPQVQQQVQTDVQFQSNSKQAKLLKDLNVVKDNIKVANELMDNKDKEVVGQILKTLQKMEVKLMQLPDILNKENEDYLYKLTLALIQDIENTKQRYEDFKAGRKLRKFKMMSDTIVYESPIKKVDVEQSQQKQQQYFQQIDQFENNNHLQNSYSSNSQQNLYSPNINSSVKKDVPLQQDEVDLLGFDLGHQNTNNSQHSNKNLQKELLQNSSHSEVQEVTQQGQFFDFEIDNNQQTSQHSSYNNLNQEFNNFQVKQNQNQNMDIDLLGLDDLNQPQQNISQQNQNSKQHPKDIIQYNKPLQEQMKKDKVEYDPFPDLDLIQLNYFHKILTQLQYLTQLKQ